MKKIAIVTLNGYFNYGNRLQNYALQEVLKSYGFYVETLVVNDVINSTQEKNNITFIYRIENLKKKSIKDILQKLKIKLWNTLHKHEIDKLKLIRTKVFKKFTEDYINEAEFCISDSNIPKDLADQYDFFVVGSDQVWNPNYISGSSIYFLTFARRHQRIAYAPSFGISELPEKYIDDFRKWLSEMGNLSVRETVGAKIIYELTGRKAKVLIDPTLMLSKERWLSIAKEAANKSKKRDILLTYFLGGISEDNKKIIKRIAKEKNYQIINLASIYDSQNYIVDPDEFIDYINSSSIIFTDSLHGTIFSILFEKPFVVFDRKSALHHSMKSRFETLLSTFRLEARKWENIKNVKNILNIDYSHIPSILEVERNRALDYLKDALDIKDTN